MERDKYLVVPCPFCKVSAGSECVPPQGWASKNPEDHVHGARIYEWRWLGYGLPFALYTVGE